MCVPVWGSVRKHRGWQAPKFDIQDVDQRVRFLGVKPLPSLRVQGVVMADVGLRAPRPSGTAERDDPLPSLTQDIRVRVVPMPIGRVHPSEHPFGDLCLVKPEVQPQRAVVLCTERNEMEPVIVWCIRRWSVANKEDALCRITVVLQELGDPVLDPSTQSRLQLWFETVEGFTSGHCTGLLRRHPRRRPRPRRTRRPSWRP